MHQSTRRCDLAWLAALILAVMTVVSLGGCVAYPTPDYYGGGYAYAPPPFVVAPVIRPYGWGGGWGPGWGPGWRRGYGYRRW